MNIRGWYGIPISEAWKTQMWNTKLTPRNTNVQYLVAHRKECLGNVHLDNIGDDRDRVRDRVGYTWASSWNGEA